MLLPYRKMAWLSLTVMSVLLLSCSQKLQTLQINEVTINFSHAISQIEADALGQYISKGLEAQSLTVKMDKRDNTYIIELQVINSELTAEFKDVARAFSRDLFQKQPVELHLVNAQLETFKIFTSH